MLERHEYQSGFNDYDESGFRINCVGRRTSKTEDEAILYNLRYRWHNELAKLSNNALLDAYDAFAVSELFGDNDNEFLAFLDNTL